MLGQVRLAQKVGARTGRANHQLARHQVDVALVTFEHVEADYQIHRLIFHYRKCGANKIVSDLNLASVNSAEDLLRSDSLRHPRKSRIQQAHQVALSGTRGAHDRHLRAGIDKRFDLAVVHLALDVQHDHRAEHFGRFFHRDRQRFVDRFLILVAVYQRT